MPVITLKVIALSGSADDYRGPEQSKPLFRGNGDTDYVCGHCGAVIAASMSPTQHVIVDSTICPGCGSQNEFPPSIRA